MVNQAAGTAYGPMLIIALEQHYPLKQRLVEDKMAYQFFSPIFKIIIKLSRLLLLRRFIFNLSESRARGVWMGVICRKRYIDEKVNQALKAGMDSIVILGAGLDTHAYRLPPHSFIKVFEVDLPENITYKELMLKKIFGRIPNHVSLVPVDFEKNTLVKALSASGYKIKQQSLFIWEAVTQYLTETAVRKTFDFLAKAGIGSQLVFTYVPKDFIQGKNFYGLKNMYRLYREKTHLWRFGLAPEEVAIFLSQYNWQELEQIASREYKQKYLKPTGRELSIMEIERAVYAEKVK